MIDLSQKLTSDKAGIRKYLLHRDQFGDRAYCALVLKNYTPMRKVHAQNFHYCFLLYYYYYWY